MNIRKIAAFSDGDTGGNPAGVVIVQQFPSDDQMQAIAAEVGYSETAFAMPADGGWRVRYFAPEREVPFCGHATIALGAALAKQNGDAIFNLILNDAQITVEGKSQGDKVSAALQSPATFSSAVDEHAMHATLQLFSLSTDQLDQRMPLYLANAGANHFIVMLNSRQALADMQYDINAGRQLMADFDIVTILLGYAEEPQLFHTRNPFASGGVYEDPATGAATAALAGYLRDINWPHGGKIDVIQGEDMGMRSLLAVNFSDEPGSSIRVSGSARFIE